MAAYANGGFVSQPTRAQRLSSALIVASVSAWLVVTGSVGRRRVAVAQGTGSAPGSAGSGSEAEALHKLSPTDLAAQPGNKIRDADPEEFAKLSSVQVRALTSEQVKLLSPELIKRLDKTISALRPDQVSALSKEAVALLPVEQIAVLTRVQFDALVHAHKDTIAQWSIAQLTAVPGENRGLLPDTAKAKLRVEMNERAIKPGIRLIGDAYSQLVKTAQEDIETQNSFGGGVEIESLDANYPTRSTLVIRKGSKPSTLESPEEFGDAILNPQSQNIFFGIEFVANPRKMRWVNNLGGFYLRFYSARTDWKIKLAEARDADPMDPTIDARPEQTEVTGVYTFGLAGGLVWRYVASQGDNYIDVEGVLGPTFRWLSYDSGIDDRIAAKRLMDDRISDQPFLNYALGVDDRFFVGAELGVAIRVNAIVLRATVSWNQGDISGLSDWRFIPALSLRAGPQLIEFDKVP